MRNELDMELQDEVTVDEIHLVTQLMLVAAMAPGELDQDVIDDVLGLDLTRRGLPSQRRARPSVWLPVQPPAQPRPE